MRRAYTLLEILIALSLLTIVISVIGATVHQQTRLLSVSRTTVLESELARAILERIARDLRSAIIIEEKVVEEETGEASTTSSDAIMWDPLFGDLAIMSSSETDESEEAEEIVGSRTGIYGGTEWLQIDTFQMPRYDSRGGKVTRTTHSFLSDRISAIKTVFYYIGEDTGIVESPAIETTDSLGRTTSINSAPRCGLFRRVLDRAAHELLLDEGRESEYEPHDFLLAPEITAIEFLYFDGAAPDEDKQSGIAWLDSWDMETMETLPKGIKITLWLRRANGEPLAFSLIVAL